MDFAHLFEAAMLVCFGFSWPLNVIKAYKARTAKGTSLAYIILIITGYIAGISAKIINNQFNYVLVVYFLNLAIVMVNVFVFIRNVRLDNQKSAIVTKQKIRELQKKYKNVDYTFSSEENMNFKELNKIAEKNSVILLGSSMAKDIPVTELVDSFGFDFKLYNRSEENLSVKNAKEFFEANISPLEPEAVIIHIGEKDLKLFGTSASDFDNYYMELLNSVTEDKSRRVALVSVNNRTGDAKISEMNKHIKALADSFHADFINLDNAKLWNPKATKAAVDFAASMGLRTKKPLKNIAEILYSYACLEMQDDSAHNIAV